MLDFKLLNSQAFLNGELIFRAFLSKFEKYLENSQVLYIAPDNFLNLISFSSLIMNNELFMTQRYHIKRLQTARDLLTFQSSTLNSGTLIAIGGVDFGNIQEKNQNSGRIFNFNKMKYLAHSVEEVSKIGLLYEIFYKKKAKIVSYSNFMVDLTT